MIAISGGIRPPGLVPGGRAIREADHDAEGARRARIGLSRFESIEPSSLPLSTNAKAPLGGFEHLVARGRSVRDKSALPIWTPKAPRRGDEQSEESTELRRRSRPSKARVRIDNKSIRIHRTADTRIFRALRN